MIPAQQYVGEKSTDTVTLHIWPGTGGELHWYEMMAPRCSTSAECATNAASTSRSAGRKTQLRFGPVSGSFPSQVKKWRVILRAAGRAVRPGLEGQLLPTTFVRELKFCAFELVNRTGEFEVSWR